MPQDKEVAESLQAIAHSIIMLGNAGATTPEGSQWGGLEAHGKAIMDAAEKIADALRCC